MAQSFAAVYSNIEELALNLGGKEINITCDRLI